MNKRLLIMSGLSFIAMYVLMYAMADKFSEMHANSNSLYMALLMTSVMVLLELAVMGAMYEKRLKISVALVSILVFGISLASIRLQLGITDKAFLRSMIPHHSAALLMCKQAHLTDPDIQSLCASILKGQQAEIEWMEKKLTE